MSGPHVVHAAKLLMQCLQSSTPKVFSFTTQNMCWGSLPQVRTSQTCTRHSLPPVLIPHPPMNRFHTHPTENALGPAARAHLAHMHQAVPPTRSHSSPTHESDLLLQLVADDDVGPGKGGERGCKVWVVYMRGVRDGARGSSSRCKVQQQGLCAVGAVGARCGRCRVQQQQQRQQVRRAAAGRSREERGAGRVAPSLTDSRVSN